MEFVDLRTGYLLTGFTNFESAFAASEELCENGYKVAYLNEASHMREQEVQEYVKSVEITAGQQKYQNYRFMMWEQAKGKAVESLRTALEVLEEKTNCRSRFVMIVTSSKMKSFKLQKQNVKPLTVTA
jgi:thymidylate synthase